MNLEQEIRVLNSSAELIENYVNYAVCCFPDERLEVVTSVQPKDHIAQNYFFILLSDMIVAAHKEIIPNKNNGDSLLHLLHKISIAPQLNNDKNSSINLKDSTEKFLSWLKEDFQYELYSENIGKEICIKLNREVEVFLRNPTSTLQRGK